MYYRFRGALGEEKVKVPEEIAQKLPKNLNGIARDDSLSDIVSSGKYYDKIISKEVAEFLMEVHTKAWLEGHPPFCDKMEVEGIAVSVLVSYIGNEAHTNMFAYRKRKGSGWDDSKKQE